MPTCAECTKKPCHHTQDLSEAPKNCPSLGVSREESIARYSEEDKRLCRASAAVEGHGYGRLTRVEEIMDFAMRCGFHKLGIAFCVGFSKEAAILSRVLRNNGFQVESVCCKNGDVPKEEFGIPKEDHIHPDCEFEIMCNPAGQAAALDAAGCELCLVLGLCVGHDTVFLSHVKAPATYVAVKDRATGHNPLAGIYGAEGYLRRVNTFVRDHWGEKEP